ncbi:hypothetical protein PR048_024196 [Dryococelus australis]|uniref:Uncharacterized protein n=1 Tax=Dryococelus australis TaxID=614101 RepID=A0ABQ9GW77_9NEOP|nr:hypothetical protein PR048_024196 [Dryococelus australis]
MKSSGGLTHRKGISASSPARWVHPMPATSRVIDALHDFSGVVKVSLEQHFELRELKQIQDRDDMKTLLDYSLHSSLSNGLVADRAVNCDDALNIGLTSTKKMAGQLSSDLHLKRQDGQTSG